MMEIKRVAFHTLGCRLNFSESASIMAGFQDRGHQLVEFGQPADLVFINTCTVTDGADSSCRNAIRKAHRLNPEAKIVVAGCYAQMAPAEVAAMEGVDLVLGTSEKYKVFEYLEEEERQVIAVDHSQQFWEAMTTSADSHHTRAFLKIQDGCNYVCSFCIIPFARGRSKAMPSVEVLARAQQLLDQGYREIVLTGVNIGEYQESSGEKLAELVARLLDLPKLDRLRLSSVEPNTFTPELINTIKNSPKFMDHFHIPLQSGSDEILTKMRRKYNVSFYRELILQLHEAFPWASFGADVITGHPGETPEHFLQTYQLLEHLPITHFHVFPYSRRQNTTAAKDPAQILSAVRKSRAQALIQLGNNKIAQWAQKQQGRTVSVLFETCDNNGNWQGYSSNFLRVEKFSTTNLKNQILNLRPGIDCQVCL